MNCAERFFADLTADCARASSFASVRQLVDAITAYLGERNAKRSRTAGRRTGKRS